MERAFTDRALTIKVLAVMSTSVEYEKIQLLVGSLAEIICQEDISMEVARADGTR
jgi:hypothetical protein